MGIMCDNPSFVYGDNKLVLANTKVPASILKNKMNILSYNFVREGCKRDEVQFVYTLFTFRFQHFFMTLVW